MCSPGERSDTRVTRISLHSCGLHAGARCNFWSLPPIKQYAGDDEHCRHRQHMCERFRGRPLGGFLHAGFSLNLGATVRGAKTRNDRQNFYSEHPATMLHLDCCPHEANIDCAKVEQY